MTSLEQFTYALLEKNGIKRGCKDKAMLARAKVVIEGIIIPSQIKNAYKAAEKYIGGIND